ncbi:hypothetical protein GCM10020331_078320 [Ectobacillus funiculus]
MNRHFFYNIKKNERQQQFFLAEHTHQELLFRLASRLGSLNISFQTETKVLTNGEETFSSIKEVLEKAQHHIHMEYYIVRDDKNWN